MRWTWTALALCLASLSFADPAFGQNQGDWWSRSKVFRSRYYMVRTDFPEDEAKALPYGARRALEIAVALAARPKLLFLDEPTAGLGSDGRARLAELVRKLRGTVTIAIIEHDMEFLFGLADEISVIHWGQVIARGTPAELKANPWVKASNLGRLN